MHLFLLILLSLVALYLLGLATALLLSVFLIRQKLRQYQENGRFGY